MVVEDQFPSCVNGGLARIEVARRSFPLSATALTALPGGEGRQIGLALPVDPALACLAKWLIKRGYAVSVLVGAAPQPVTDLIAALSEAGVTICDTRETFLELSFDILLDSNGDLLSAFSRQMQGGTIANSTFARKPKLLAPAIHIGASPLIELCSHHGIGQACVSGFLDITNLQVAGSQVLVLGYTAIGQGIAKYARAYGGRVIVCESDPVLSVKARIDGHQVSGLERALPQAKVVFAARELGRGLSMAQIKQLPRGAFLCSASTSSEAFPVKELQEVTPGKVVRDHVTQRILTSSSFVMAKPFTAKQVLAYRSDTLMFLWPHNYAQSRCLSRQTAI